MLELFTFFLVPKVSMNNKESKIHVILALCEFSVIESLVT